MKNTSRVIFSLTLAVCGAVPTFAEAGAPQADPLGNCGNFTNVSTYGNDNRQEYCAQNVMIRTLADSVAGLFTDGSSVTLTGQGYVFGTKTLGESEKLAPGQRFADQPSAAFCTGFLVGDNLLVTAGHCVRDHLPDDTTAPKDHAGPCQENPHHPFDPHLNQGTFCENIRVVFGFRKELGGYLTKSAPARDVYKCAGVVAHSLGSGPDYTVIRLNRPVRGRLPLAINRKNAGLSRRTPLVVIGHPSGLPLKIAGDAAVLSSGTDVYVNSEGVSRKWVDKGYSFLTNLDTFHGNSGSPVFNLNTLLVEGILVSGDADYEEHPKYPGQNRVTKYPQNTGGSELGKGVGEVCTKISVPAGKIPKTAHEADMLEMNRKAKFRLYPVMLERLLRPSGIPIPNYPVKRNWQNIQTRT